MTTRTTPTTAVPAPPLAVLRAAVDEFGGYLRPDASWETLLAATGGQPDPARPEHRPALLTWLNAWGCRIRKPRPGEPDAFSDGIGEWWAEHHGSVCAPGTRMTDLTDAEIDGLGDCFAALCATRVAPARTLGSTAASKMLYALRPSALWPWDEAIATRLYGRRDGSAYAAHLRLGRDWARALLTAAGRDEAEFAADLGCPGRPLTKLLDDYCYIVYTRYGGVYSPST